MATLLGDYTASAMAAGKGEQLLSCLLVAGYAYYSKDETLMPDELFDQACKTLIPLWPKLKHPHKRCVTLGDLKAGTLYSVREYPLVVRYAAILLIDQQERSTNEDHPLQRPDAMPERLPTDAGRSPADSGDHMAGSATQSQLCLL